MSYCHNYCIFSGVLICRSVFKGSLVISWLGKTGTGTRRCSLGWEQTQGWGLGAALGMLLVPAWTRAACLRSRLLVPHGKRKQRKKGFCIAHGNVLFMLVWAPVPLWSPVPMTAVPGRSCPHPVFVVFPLLHPTPHWLCPDRGSSARCHDPRGHPAQSPASLPPRRPLGDVRVLPAAACGAPAGA